MKLYKLSQEENNYYDTYDSLVVCAECEEEARKISPNEFYQCVDGRFIWSPKVASEQEDPNQLTNDWATEIENVKVEYLGEAKEGMEKGIIVSSYNAG